MSWIKCLGFRSQSQFAPTVQSGSILVGCSATATGLAQLGWCRSRRCPKTLRKAGFCNAACTMQGGDILLPNPIKKGRPGKIPDRPEDKPQKANYQPRF